MPDDTAAPFGRKQRDWVLAWRVGVFILATLGAAGGGVFLFAGRAFVKEAAAAELAPVAGLPARVAVLETERARQDRDQRATATAVSTIQQDVASIKATQAESAKNTERSMERILNRLDALAERR